MISRGGDCHREACPGMLPWTWTWETSMHSIGNSLQNYCTVRVFRRDPCFWWYGVAWGARRGARARSHPPRHGLLPPVRRAFRDAYWPRAPSAVRCHQGKTKIRTKIKNTIMMKIKIWSRRGVLSDQLCPTRALFKCRACHAVG